MTKKNSLIQRNSLWLFQKLGQVNQNKRKSTREKKPLTKLDGSWLRVMSLRESGQQNFHKTETSKNENWWTKSKTTEKNIDSLLPTDKIECLMNDCGAKKLQKKQQQNEKKKWNWNCAHNQCTWSNGPQSVKSMPTVVVCFSYFAFRGFHLSFASIRSKTNKNPLFSTCYHQQRI